MTQYVDQLAQQRASLLIKIALVSAAGGKVRVSPGDLQKATRRMLVEQHDPATGDFILTVTDLIPPDGEPT